MDFILHGKHSSKMLKVEVGVMLKVEVPSDSVGLTKISYESPRHNPGLRCNPGHVVIIFTRVTVANGARRYDSTI